MHIEDGRELIERLERGPGEEFRIFATEGGIAIQLFRRTPGGEWVPGEERLENPASPLDRLREIPHEGAERAALDPPAAAPPAPPGTPEPPHRARPLSTRVKRSSAGSSTFTRSSGSTSPGAFRWSRTARERGPKASPRISTSPR